MSDEVDNIKNKLVYTYPPACHHCYNKDSDLLPSDNEYLKFFQLGITNITSEDDGWLAKGIGRSENVNLYCQNCGMQYNAIMHFVPIICHSFNCPKCGKAEHLEHKLNLITSENDSSTFEFEVKIECGVCKKKRSVKKVLREILSILKIEVKPTGITVKKS